MQAVPGLQNKNNFNQTTFRFSKPLHYLLLHFLPGTTATLLFCTRTGSKPVPNRFPFTEKWRVQATFIPGNASPCSKNVFTSTGYVANFFQHWRAFFSVLAAAAPFYSFFYVFRRRR
jgi:hypothetical protein